MSILRVPVAQPLNREVANQRLNDLKLTPGVLSTWGWTLKAASQTERTCMAHAFDTLIAAAHNPANSNTINKLPQAHPRFAETSTTGNRDINAPYKCACQTCGKRDTLRLNALTANILADVIGDSWKEFVREEESSHV